MENQNNRQLKRAEKPALLREINAPRGASICATIV
jgi:hypothetical protein